MYLVPPILKCRDWMELEEVFGGHLWRRRENEKAVVKSPALVEFACGGGPSLSLTHETMSESWNKCIIKASSWTLDAREK